MVTLVVKISPANLGRANEIAVVISETERTPRFRERILDGLVPNLEDTWQNALHIDGGPRRMRPDLCSPSS